MSNPLQLRVSKGAFDSGGLTHIPIIHAFHQTEGRANGRLAKAQKTRREHRKMRVSCVRVIGPAKQMVNKRSPPSGFVRYARAWLFLVIQPLMAMIEKLAPIGFQDETGFHYGSIGEAQPHQSVRPTKVQQRLGRAGRLSGGPGRHRAVASGNFNVIFIRF